MAADAQSTRRWTAAAVLAAAACLAIGTALVRASGSDADERAASASQPPTTATIQPAATQVDETSAQSEDGAEVAAVRVVAASQDWLYLTDDDVRASVLAVATPGAGPALAELTVDDVSTARSDLGLSPGPVWWVVHPLASRVVDYTPQAAQVEVWAVTILAAVDVAAPQAEWLTIAVDLAWDGQGWLVESIRDRPGPSPMLGPRDQPWDAAPFTDALDGFERLEGGPLDEAVVP